MSSDPSIRLVVEDVDTPLSLDDITYRLAWTIVGQLIVDLFVHDQPPDDIHVREVISDGYMYMLEIGGLPNILDEEGRHGTSWGFPQLCMSLFDHHSQTLFGLMNYAERTVVVLPALNYVHVQKTPRGRVVTLLVHHRFLLQAANVVSNPKHDDGLSSILTLF